MRRTDLIISLSLLVLLVAACAPTLDQSRAREWGLVRAQSGDVVGYLQRCTGDLAAIDEAIERAGVRDAQTARIPGFPYLRTTRFLAALAPKIGEGDEQAFRFWSDNLNAVAQKAWAYELANLPSSRRKGLQARLGKSPRDVVHDCATELEEFDRRHHETRAILTSAIGVPDNYADWTRVIGIYPLTSFAVKYGFERWKDQNLPSFARAPSELKPEGDIKQFAPASEHLPMTPKAVAELLRRQSGNPLEIPLPSDAELLRLAGNFAPVFSIDVTGAYDLIGTPVLESGGVADIDTRAPRAYVQPSWTIFGGAPLLQISYLVWFSERPPAGDVDILAGRLDGIIWRVTIGRDGRPLLYDSIHPCGCYHLFFPVPPVRPRDRPIDEPGEGTVVPMSAPVLGAGQRIVLHISSGDHYLRNLSVTESSVSNTGGYALAPMDNLRSLPTPGGGTRSLYDSEGLVTGTERAERFLLWPMGVPSAGAMRQWGTHATAFVGRRHFDDPHLLEKAFSR